jgi:hypothetical protein
MSIAWGIAFAVLACCLAAWSGMDRSRAFYPTLLIVIATYYILFAVHDGRIPVILAETAIASVFSALALAAFRWNAWLLVAGLATHGMFDVAHDLVIQDHGVPAWWPHFCSAFDITAAALVGFSTRVRGDP